MLYTVLKRFVRIVLRSLEIYIKTVFVNTALFVLDTGRAFNQIVKNTHTNFMTFDKETIKSN